VKRTLAIRFCAWCDSFIGFALWPWTPSKGWIAVTHGQCPACGERMAAEAALEG